MPGPTVRDLLPGSVESSALDENAAFRDWAPELKALWYDLGAARICREMRFLHFVGLALCLACLILDAQADILELGLLLRFGLLSPLYVLGIALLGNKRGWVRSAAAIVPVASFAGVASYIGLAAGSEFADRYVLAASMLIAICILLFPLRTSAIAALAAAGFSAISLPILATGSAAAESIDLVSFAFLCSTIPAIIKVRGDRLKDKNFVLALKGRLAQKELLASNRQLEDLSNLDPLTGLLNRRGFEKRFEAAFEAAQQSGEPLALLLMDLDHFKSFNDTHGHQLGDRCLVEVGQVLKGEVTRNNGVVGRYGGEEFIAVLVGAASANCVRIAQGIGKRIRELSIADKNGRSALITVSAGIRIARPRAAIRCDLIRDADRALYAAKEAGRDRVVLFTDEVENGPDAREPDSLNLAPRSLSRVAPRC